MVDRAAGFGFEVGALPCYVVLELEASCLVCRHARKLERWGAGKVHCLQSSEIHPVEHVCDRWEGLVGGEARRLGVGT